MSVHYSVKNTCFFVFIMKNMHGSWHELIWTRLFFAAFLGEKKEKQMSDDAFFLPDFFLFSYAVVHTVAELSSVEKLEKMHSTFLYLFLYLFVYFCTFLYFFVPFCIFLPFCISLYTFVHFCTFLYHFVH